MEHARNIVAVVQARMGSTRLPGKVLADIGRTPMLGRLAYRLAGSRTVSKIIVATSTAPNDDPIEAFCRGAAIEVFRGSESDVLDRFYQAALSLNADAVVRVTADCPLIDPQIVDRVIAGFLESGCDYASNTLVCSYPDGLDVEVFSFRALETAWLQARRASEREHVTPFMRWSDQFRRRNVESEIGHSLSHLRWTVDEPCDLEFMRAIFARFAPKQDFGWREVLRLLDAEPELARLNAGLSRNLGYYHSIALEPPLPATARDLKRSRALQKRCMAVVPAGSQTFSKGPTQYVQGVAPNFLVRGKGSHVWDTDGNEYIDYPMALGPIILGHCYPAVTTAVERQLAEGCVFSLPHALEIEVAEQMAAMIPCAEMARFAKNGSDATAGAVRAARALTGRDKIACCGYHGWQDWYIGTTTRNRGVPKAVQSLTLPFEYNNVESLKRLFAEHTGEIAGVILEPVGIVEPQPGFLQEVRELSRREGAVLIFDEVVTGFRLARGGAQQYFGVTPDLACFGKAMANGFPLAAVVGARDIMKVFEEIFFSFTFGGEALSLAAAQVTMKEIAERNVIEHLWEQGRVLRDGSNALAREFGIERFVSCVGLPPRTVFTFFDENGKESLPLKSLFQQECLKRGVLFSGGQNLCFSHTAEDIQHTLRVYRAAMEIASEAIRSGRVSQALEGESVQPVFRRA